MSTLEFCFLTKNRTSGIVYSFVVVVVVYTLVVLYIVLFLLLAYLPINLQPNSLHLRRKKQKFSALHFEWVRGSSLLHLSLACWPIKDGSLTRAHCGEHDPEITKVSWKLKRNFGNFRTVMSTVAFRKHAHTHTKNEEEESECCEERSENAMCSKPW
jgi:hypothetical protein